MPILKFKRTLKKAKDNDPKPQKMDAPRRNTLAALPSLENGQHLDDKGKQRDSRNSLVQGKQHAKFSTNFNGPSNLEDIRERRLSDIAQLDRYIKHLRQTADDNTLSCLTSRLCCAEVLKKVFWRQEQEYVNDLLHGRREVPGMGRRFSCPAPSLASLARGPLNHVQSERDLAHHFSKLELDNQCRNQGRQTQLQNSLNGVNTNASTQFYNGLRNGIVDQVKEEEEEEEEEEAKEDINDNDEEEETEGENKGTGSGSHIFSWTSCGPRSQRRQSMATYPSNFDIY